MSSVDLIQATMRKERHMSMIDKARLRNRRGAIVAMGLGLLLTVVESIALVIDQTAVHSIAHHLSALYAPYGLHPDPDWFYYYLYATAAIGILLWLTTIWVVGRRKRGARLVATTVFVVATGIALLNLSVSEYGTRIFPLFWGILGLLPCVGGLAAVFVLWTTGRAKDWP